jgi:2,4-dienoyl-CoA reductase-like NADH-dependent reductase (Old Yellow Enzyme family)
MNDSTADPGQPPPQFEPIGLGSVEVRNRIVMTDHGTGLAEDHLPSERYVAHHRERAMGGAGLIGMAFPRIHPTPQDVPGEAIACRSSLEAVREGERAARRI